MREQIDREAREQIESQTGVRRMMILASARIPERYKAATLEGEHAKALSEWLVRAQRGRASLLMLGPTGTGKTHLACGLLNAAAAAGVRCRYVTSAGFLTQITSSWNDDLVTEQQVFAEYVSPALLVLDDVGAHSGADTLRLKISKLIDDRYLAAKATAVLSNLTPKQLHEEIGDRAYSRVHEDVTNVVVKGDDRRRAK